MSNKIKDLYEDIKRRLPFVEHFDMQKDTPMIYKIEELDMDIKRRLPWEEYDEISRKISYSNGEILFFLKDCFDLCSSKGNKEVLNDELTKQAIWGMNTINRYCDNFGHERIFEFDENDLASILKCLSVYDVQHAVYTKASLDAMDAAAPKFTKKDAIQKAKKFEDLIDFAKKQKEEEEKEAKESPDETKDKKNGKKGPGSNGPGGDGSR